jgi:transcriptional regulator with XRE-family HTH domain
MEARQQVGQRLKEARSRSGYSMSDLKKIIDPAYLSRIENGKVPVGVDVLQRIADAMKMTLTITFESKKDINW